jgi:hypothetical protein
MQEHFWFHDHHEYEHDGSRADLSNLLNNHCYTSSRLQEVCQAQYKVCIITTTIRHARFLTTDRTWSSWLPGKTENRNSS